MKMVNLRRPPAGVNLQGASFIGGMADVNDHVARVAAGGGTGANELDLFKIYRFLHSHGLLSGTKLLWTPEAGYVHRVDGVLKYCRTGFDTSLYDNDLDGSATASQQPRLVGGIAPNSKTAASNQTGESRKFTHATITVTGTYTVVKMLNTTGKYVNTYTEVVGGTITECTWTGGMRLYMVYAGVLSAGQRAIIDAFVLTLYPEIESVVIATQTWASRNFEAVATPLGNMIPNVTENGAVEKNQDPAHDTGIGWSGNGVVSGGTLTLTATGSNRFAFNTWLTPAVVGKFYKLTIAISSNTLTGAGTFNIGGYSGSSVFGITSLSLSTNVGTKSYIFKSNALSAKNILDLWFSAGFTYGSLVFDSINCQELNWSNATEIYDAVYAATAGTTAQKEYAALKEAAMWCYYNNDHDNGAIYGKLYNWYAAKLLDLDMVTAGFGWRVPTSAQFTTLADALGGASVAGGKLKMTGAGYWATPNIEATNESGFTALGGGYRNTDGTLAFNLKTGCKIWSSDKYGLLLVHNSEIIVNANDVAQVRRGYSLRLIKNS